MYSRIKLRYPAKCGKTYINAELWKPKKATAVLQITHGVSGNIGRYSEFADTLANEGYAVFISEHTGHGKSISEELPLGSFGGWMNAVSDLHTLSKFARRMYPELPFFIFGHSMGSFMVRTYLSKYHEPVAGCILCGTAQLPHSAYLLGRALTDADSAVRGRNGSSPILYGAGMRSYCRRIKGAERGNEWITRDAEVLAARSEEPFVPSSGLLQDMIYGLEYNAREETTAKIDKNIPFFLISGTEDPVGGYGKGVLSAASALTKAGIEDVSVRFYPGARHELLKELNRDEVIRDIKAWLREKENL